GPCGVPTLSGAPASRQASGGTVVFTASTAVCPKPNYRFLLSAPGQGWTVVQDYGAANTFTWTTTGLAGSYRVEVDVRNQGSTAGYENWAQTGYVVAGCGGAHLATMPASPQSPGGTITLTASATCPGTATYRFLVGGTMVQDYGTANTYGWSTAGLAAGVYGPEVDVRNQGSAAGYEGWVQLSYTLAGCSAARLTTDLTSPQASGKTIVLTASATCPGTPEYRFLVNGTVAGPY